MILTINFLSIVLYDDSLFKISHIIGLKKNT